MASAASTRPSGTRAPERSAGTDTSMPCDDQTSVNSQRRYRLSRSVTLRPEPFGALAYDFAARRLTYLAAPDLVAVIGQLSTDCGPRSAADAMTAAGVAADRRPVLHRALANLVERGVLDAA